MKPDDPTHRLDDEAIARLIEGAGPRAPIPAEDLDAIAAAARSAWEARSLALPLTIEGPDRPMSLRATDGDVGPGAQRRGQRRAAARSNGLLALAASLLALVIGAAVWWSSRPSAAPEAPAEVVIVATLEAATGPVRVEVAGADRPLTVGQPIAAGAWLRTGGRGETGEAPPARAALRMRSGAIVRLDVGTSIRVASATQFDLVHGALYADTGLAAGAGGGPSAGPAATLEVRTQSGTARDVGTRFMVRLPEAPDRPALEVLVRDGTVAVESSGESESAAAGEQLVVTRDGALERRAVSPHGPEWAWVMEAAAPFELEGRTVAEILAWMSRETGYTVRYEDIALAEAARRIPLEGGGEATRRMKPDQAPLLLPAAGLEGLLEDGVLTVRRLR